MKLQTNIPLHPEENQIDYKSKVLLMGSCFVENIGDKLEYYKFQNLVNPFGTIFNPVSIEKLIVRAIDNHLFSEDDIFQHNGIYKCFDVHSEISALNKNQLLQNLNSALWNLRESLFSATHIIFTFGTSWVYRHIQKDEIAANCHKLPQEKFKKELLSVNEISKSIQHIFNKISGINPNAIIIDTVSPVRHIKDGFVENSVSKAHLLSAIHKTIHQPSTINQQLFYFPSFEIMMDELRDYRFYAEDMLHPNKTAISIIWDKFKEVWVSIETNSTQKEIAIIQSGLLHRPFNPKSEEYLQFSKKLEENISSLLKRFPHIRF